MARVNVDPNRMELSRLKKRLAVAIRRANGAQFEPPQHVAKASESTAGHSLGRHGETPWQPFSGRSLYGPPEVLVAGQQKSPKPFGLRL